MGSTGVDALPYIDALIKEYLLFRGFTYTLSAFNKDLAADPGCGFQAERITELIFRQLIPGLDCQELVEFLDYLNMQLYSRLDSRYEPLVSAVEADLLRLFLVTAHKAGRPERMADFFRLYGPQLISSSSSSSSSSAATQAAGWPSSGAAAQWQEWFLLPYLQHPEKEQRFRLYFSSEWASLLEVSFRNFVAGVVRSLPLPALLRFNTDRRLRLALQQQVHALQSELADTQQQLAEALSAGQQQRSSTTALQQQTGVGQGLSQPAGRDAQLPAVGANSTQHSRQASLGDWQRSIPPHAAAAGGGAGGPDVSAPLVALQGGSSSFAVPAAAGTESSSAGTGSALLPHHRRQGGSGLFELLPQHSGSVGAGVAAAKPQQQQQQQQQQQGAAARHARTGSFSGSISFEVPPALAVDSGLGVIEGGAEAHEPPASDVDAAQHQQQQQQPPTGGLPIPQAATRPPPLLPPPQQGLAGSKNARSSPTGVGSGLLSTSPVLSWAGAVSSSAGVRPVYVPAGGMPHSATVPGISVSGGGPHTGPHCPRTTAPLLVPTAVSAPAAAEVSQQRHATSDAAASSGSGSVVAVAFSPSGGNVASVVSGSSAVHIWSPAGVPGGNAARAAVVSCGSPVTCVAWDSRADKLMLIGCGAGGGVRAYHPDTRRFMDSVPSEPGFPVVAAVAASPCEPTFVVAANSSSSSSSGALQARLVAYNTRSFKRSSVLAVPDDAGGLASLAFSSSGSQLLVGTNAGSALLYEPNSRSMPVAVWQVAAAVAPRSRQLDRSSSCCSAVQVMWEPVGGQAAASVGGGASSRMLTLCDGVLCQWQVPASSNRPPFVAFDMLAAAEAAVQQQQQEAVATEAAAVDALAPQPAAARWYSCAAVSPTGSSVAVLCSAQQSGVLLLLRRAAGGSSQSSWGPEAHVVLCGELLAGCAGALSWHGSGEVLVVGAKDSSSICVLVTP